ncbi:MAG: hypothetical protein ABI600_01880 [Luteolibacter sp.]
MRCKREPALIGVALRGVDDDHHVECGVQYRVLDVMSKLQFRFAAPRHDFFRPDGIEIEQFVAIIGKPVSLGLACDALLDAQAVFQ